MKMLAPQPDAILHNGRFYTVDVQNPWAEAVAVRSGRIVAIGDAERVLALAGPDTVTVDLAGRLALPGLCDAHIHFYNWSLAQAAVNLASTHSKQEMLQMVAARSAVSRDDAWIVGQGWNESWWGDIEYPTADDLDSVTAHGQPAIFWRTDMHAAVVNHRALSVAQITAGTADPVGGVIERDATGAPTGVLKELAIGLVAGLVPPATAEQAKHAIRDGIAALHSMGVTAIHDQRMKGHDDGVRALAAYQSLDAAGELTVRVNCNLAAHQLPAMRELGLSYGFGNDRLRLGHVKVFADGSLGSQTALMHEPFLNYAGGDAEQFGVRLTEPETMAEIFRDAAQLGFPISVHAIGDRAIREVLDIFEELQQSTPALRAPHRIEHVQILRPADRPRLGEMGITASVQPVHVIDDIEIADRILGERGATMYNFRSLLATGALLAFGSDAPVADPNPFLGIHAALYRQRPSRMDAGSWHGNECITLEEAIYAYTLGAAWAVGWQNEIGSLEIGKRADIIAVDRNLFEIVESEVSGQEIAGTAVDFVMFDGEVTHSQLD